MHEADGAAWSQALTGKKSRLLTYALWFFLGLTGIHRVYIGKYGTGAAMFGLALSLIVLGLSSTRDNYQLVVALKALVVLPLLGMWLYDGVAIRRWTQKVQ